MPRRFFAAVCASALLGSACTGDAFDAANGAGANDGGIDAGSNESTTGNPMAIDSPITVPVDATTPSPTDAPVDDAPRDVAAPDSPKDAVAPDAAAGWCVGKQVAFCADFDRVNALTDGWTTANVTVGAALDFNLVSFTSPKRSMHSKLPVGGGPNTTFSTLNKVVTTALGHSVLEFNCNVASIGMAPAGWLVQIARLGRNGTESGVGLYAESTGTWAILVAFDQIVFAADLPAPPKFGSFVRVTFDVIWSATAGSVHVAFDGVTVLAKDAIATTVTPTTKTIELTVGLSDASGNTPAAEMSVDDVTLQLR